MQRSTDRILTTHAGALQRPLELIEALKQSEGPEATAEPLRSAVADVVQRQVEAGLAVVNDGEFGKAIWHWYIFQRLDGFERRPFEIPYFVGRDRDRFQEFYAYADGTWREGRGGPTGELFYGHDEEPWQADNDKALWDFLEKLHERKNEVFEASITNKTRRLIR